MPEPSPLELTEDRIPFTGIEESIRELVELYGGEIMSGEGSEWRFVLPLRRGLAVAGGVECTLSWAPVGEREATVRLVCDRDLDAPKAQRILMLSAGVVGALLFTIWPFYGRGNALGTLAWVGGALALAVYFLTLKKTSGGLAHDFLQRLARRQRSMAGEEPA
ncbi:MAG TPA: hypothetical protein VEZ11_05615 [Thermoanaerobaculia bacterium]|nr:hypothetical protein [Thermoanaerobaculia bacterium]